MLWPVVVWFGLLAGLAVTLSLWLRERAKRRRAEAVLKEASERSRSLFEDAPVACHEIDQNGILTRVNRAECELLGWREDEVVGRPVWELVALEEREISRAAVRRKCSGEQPLGVFHRPFLRRDGVALALRLHEQPIHDAGGRLSGIRTTLLDITELQRSLEGLRQSQELLRLIVDNSREAFVSTDQEFHIIDWNQEAEALFGWKREEILGRPWVTLLPARDRQEHEERARRFLNGEHREDLSRRRELWAVHRDGREIPVEMTVAAVHQAGRWIFSAFLHDISQRRQVEEELRRARDAAVESARLKAEFLANMSHEIRTPLNGIIGMSELVLDTQLTPEQWEYIGTVQESANSLLTIINDILDFSKIDAGKLDLDPIPFSLRYTVESTMKTLALRAHQKGLELACRIPPAVPDALVGDPGRLRQVVVNLVGNAVKFTAQGEVVLTVAPVAIHDEHVDLQFTVRDSGIGIEPEKRACIFEAFRQADSSMTRKYGGTGLGLAITSRLVNMMGGQIQVDSEVGKGSTFHFTVPFLLQKDPVPLPVTSEINLAGMPVLIVDDNHTNRRILEETVASWGMLASSAESGPAGLAMMSRARAAGQPFPLVLVDACMPGMDGFALIEQIRHNPQLAGATIMMLTSAGQRGDAARCRELGVAAYLIKPVKQSELREALVQALGRGQRAEAARLVTRHSLSEGRRTLHVLLAEDNPVNQQLAVRLLQKRGHTVEVAGTGREALAALERRPFDLVLMDVQMPEMDGLEATAVIRQREQASGDHLPIVAMTAHAMKGDRERCLATGMDEYLPKPIRADDLFLVIERVFPEQAPAAPAAAAPAAKSSLLDLDELLSRVEGDRELLATMISLFLEECPSRLQQMQEAIARRDSKSLEREAHALKGSISTFGAADATAAALRLEMMGRQGEWEGVEGAWAAMQQEMARLQPALASLAGREMLCES